MIAEIGVLCGSCGSRNKGKSSDCRHCGSRLLVVHAETDDNAEQWVVEQMALRVSNGLSTDDKAAEQLLAWVQSFGVEIAPDGRVTFVEPVEQVTSSRQAPSTGDAQPSASRSDELLAAILRMLRGFALFLILSFVSSFLAMVGFAAGIGSGEGGGLALALGGLVGIGAVVALVMAWSKSGSPFN